MTTAIALSSLSASLPSPSEQPLPATRHTTSLASRHSLCDHPLQSKLLLLQVIAASVLDLKLRHSVAQRTLDLLLLAPLQLHGHCWVGHDLLDTADVRFKLLPGFELLAEGLVGSLELGGVYRYR